MNLENLHAAVELHRPVGYDKYSYPTADPEKVTRWRCNECQASITATGCRTWKTANY